MRMWMVDPRILCQKHLCGEHVELHMFLSHIKLKRKVDGYIDNNLLEPRSIYERHCDLQNEMIGRGYNHKSPLLLNECVCVLNIPEHQQYNEINKDDALNELLNRCPKCKKNFEELHK